MPDFLKKVITVVVYEAKTQANRLFKWLLAKQQHQRVPDQDRGRVMIADDFDGPLPSEFLKHFKS